MLTVFDVQVRTVKQGNVVFIPFLHEAALNILS